MKIEHEFYIGLKDIDRNNKLTIKSFISFLEDIGGIHSDLARIWIIRYRKNQT